MLEKCQQTCNYICLPICESARLLLKNKPRNFCMSRIHLNRIRKSWNILLTLAMCSDATWLYFRMNFKWVKNNPQTKQNNSLHIPVQSLAVKSQAFPRPMPLFPIHKCIPIRPSNQVDNFRTHTHTHTKEPTSSLHVFWIHLKQPPFALDLLMGAYSSIKVSAHHKSWTFEVIKRWKKPNNSKVIKSPHRDIKFNLVGHGRQRTSEGHRQVNGRHRFA